MPSHTPEERKKKLQRFAVRMKNPDVELDGVVAEVTRNDLSDQANVVIRHGPKPSDDSPFPDTTRLELPDRFAKKLEPEQEVTIIIRSRGSAHNSAHED